MILILTEENIIPHYRKELLINLDLYHLRVNDSIMYNANVVVLKVNNKVKILKTKKSNLRGKTYTWDECVKYLLEL